MDNDNRAAKSPVRIAVSVTDPAAFAEACAVAADVVAAGQHPAERVEHAAEMIAMLLHTGVRVRLGGIVAEVDWQDDGEATGRSGWAMAA